LPRIIRVPISLPFVAVVAVFAVFAEEISFFPKSAQQKVHFWVFRDALNIVLHTLKSRSSAFIARTLSPRWRPETATPACRAHRRARARATLVRRPRARDERTSFHRPRATLRARSNASIAA